MAQLPGKDDILAIVSLAQALAWCKQRSTRCFTPAVEGLDEQRTPHRARLLVVR